MSNLREQEYPGGSGGLVALMLRGCTDLRGATLECLRRDPGYAEIYGWLVLSGLITAPAVLLAARAGGLALADTRLIAAVQLILAVLVIIPVLVALYAVPVSLLLRHAFGGRGSLRTTAMTGAWVALLTAPLRLVGESVQVMFERWFWGQAVAGSVISVGVDVVVLWIWARCMSITHSLKGPWRLFGGALAVAAALWLLLAMFGAQEGAG